MHVKLNKEEKEKNIKFLPVYKLYFPSKTVYIEKVAQQKDVTIMNCSKYIQEFGYINTRLPAVKFRFHTIIIEWLML